MFQTPPGFQPSPQLKELMSPKEIQTTDPKSPIILITHKPGKKIKSPVVVVTRPTSGKKRKATKGKKIIPPLPTTDTPKNKFDQGLKTLFNDFLEGFKVLCLESKGSRADGRCTAMPSQPTTIPEKRSVSQTRTPRQPPAKAPRSPATGVTRPAGQEAPQKAPPAEKLEPPSPPTSQASLTILYFRGLGRRDVWDVKCLFTALGIPSEAVQFVSFIGANVTELIVLDSLKDVVVKKLGERRVQHDLNFDPLSPKSFTNAATIERLGLSNKSGGGRLEMAKLAFVSRMDSMLGGIARQRQALRSFVRSLRDAAESGTPIGHLFGPPPPRPLLP